MSVFIEKQNIAASQHYGNGAAPQAAPPQGTLLTQSPSTALSCRSSRPISRKAPRILAHALPRCGLGSHLSSFSPHGKHSDVTKTQLDTTLIRICKHLPDVLPGKLVPRT